MKAPTHDRMFDLRCFIGCKLHFMLLKTCNLKSIESSELLQSPKYPRIVTMKTILPFTLDSANCTIYIHVVLSVDFSQGRDYYEKAFVCTSASQLYEKLKWAFKSKTIEKKPQLSLDSAFHVSQIVALDGQREKSEHRLILKVGERLFVVDGRC